MIQDALLVLQTSQTQLQRLHLQFIARHIVLQCHALLLLGMYIVYESTGQRDILLVHLHAVLNLIQVEILSQSHKTLSVQCGALSRYRHIALQLSHTYSSIHSTTGIHHLLCLKRKRVAEVGRREALCIRKVTIHHHHVAVICCRQRGIYIRQSLSASRLYTFLSKIYACLRFLKSLTARFY